MVVVDNDINHSTVSDGYVDKECMAVVKNDNNMILMVILIKNVWLLLTMITI